MNSKERQFSTETNFERTTDEFQKNVIRSNDLARKGRREFCAMDESATRR